MNTLLTSIAGQFAKPLLQAGVLPVIVTVSLLLLVTYPHYPFPLSPPAALKDVDASWQVTWATLLVLVAGMVLQALNTAILRLLSGYPWRKTALGAWMIRRKQEEFEDLRTQRDGLRVLAGDLLPVASAPGDIANSERAAAAAVNRELTPLSMRLNEDFPYDGRLVLPTRLGNVIRNFEDYPRQLYGVSTVRLWPRLLAVIDPRYAGLIDDAKTSLDFMVNCSVLFFVAGLLTAAAVWQSGPTGRQYVDGGVRTVFFIAISTLAYAAAVERARAWGSLVKASVDLFRRDLLKELEYTYTFTNVHDERRRLWAPLSALWAFPDLRDDMDVVPYTPPTPTPVVTGASSSNAVPLKVLRGISTTAGKPYETTTVTLRVQHAGDKDALQVTVRDPIPAGWTLVWGSPAATGRTAPVITSTSPTLEMAIGTVPKGSSLDLTYQLQSLVPTP